MKCKHAHVFLRDILIKYISIINIIYRLLYLIHLFAQLNDSLQGSKKLTKLNLSLCDDPDIPSLTEMCLASAVKKYWNGRTDK
jgi:hypothetical protein